MYNKVIATDSLDGDKMILLVCLITVKELGFRFKLVNFLSYLPRIDQLRLYKVQLQYHKAVLQSCDLLNFEHRFHFISKRDFHFHDQVKTFHHLIRCDINIRCNRFLCLSYIFLENSHENQKIR